MMKSQHGNTALMRASQEGHIETVRVLIEDGADVEAKDNYDETALMKASFYEHEEIVQLLKEAEIMRSSEPLLTTVT